jgi:hypothetical protein
VAKQRRRFPEQRVEQAKPNRPMTIQNEFIVEDAVSADALRGSRERAGNTIRIVAESPLDKACNSLISCVQSHTRRDAAVEKSSSTVAWVRKLAHDQNSSDLAHFPYAMTMFLLLLVGLLAVGWGMVLESRVTNNPYEQATKQSGRRGPAGETTPAFPSRQIPEAVQPPVCTAGSAAASGMHQPID